MGGADRRGSGFGVCRVLVAGGDRDGLQWVGWWGSGLEMVGPFVKFVSLYFSTTQDAAPFRLPPVSEIFSGLVRSSKILYSAELTKITVPAEGHGSVHSERASARLRASWSTSLHFPPTGHTAALFFRFPLSVEPSAAHGRALRVQGFPLGNELRCPIRVQHGAVFPLIFFMVHDVPQQIPHQSCGLNSVSSVLTVSRRKERRSPPRAAAVPKASRHLPEMRHCSVLIPS